MIVALSERLGSGWRFRLLVLEVEVAPPSGRGVALGIFDITSAPSSAPGEGFSARWLNSAAVGQLSEKTSCLEAARCGLPRLAPCESKSAPPWAHFGSDPILQHDIERLEYAESQLAAEDERDESAPTERRPPSKEFYTLFLATISERFEENARETRATLRYLAGGPIRIAPKNDPWEFVVSCALGRATCPLF